jgi:sugar (pentulose or hexulose) kinase
MQIIADLFGLNVKRQIASSSASLGAAMCAAVSIGLVNSFDEAKLSMAKTKDIFKPNPINHQLYNQFHQEAYKYIRAYTDPLLEKIHSVFI